MTMLTTNELAERWKVNPKSLSNWRVKKIGPAYVKLGDARSCKVLYRLEDVETFERRHEQQAEAAPEDTHNI